VKQRVIEEIARLNAANTIIPTLSLGAVDTTPITPPAPNAADIWLANYHKVVVLAPLISAGVITGNEAFVVALKNKIKADWKPEYLDFL
jgi:hypothetical protein